MKALSARTTRAELAALITEALSTEGLSCVLVGGAVVSIYTEDKYKSKDLDFISSADHRAIKRIMESLGFQAVGKDFVHPKTPLSVEFPTGPLGLGDRVPVKPEGKLTVDDITVQLLSPTQCVMDRLAWFYHNNDRQCLEQAVAVARQHPVKLKTIEQWSEEEGALDRYRVFLAALKVAKRG